MVHMHERKNGSLRCAPEMSVCSFIHPYTTLRSRAQHTWGSKFGVQALFLLGSEALSAARPGVRSLFVHVTTDGVCCPHAHAHAPGTCSLCLGPVSVVLFLEEALQHAGRKADRWGVIHAIQSFGAHINNACPGGKNNWTFSFLPAFPHPLPNQKNKKLFRAE